MKIDIRQLEFIDKKLRDILVWLEETGLEFTITSLFRINDQGVHGTLPVRGADLRIRNFGVGKCIEIFINKTWQYNPGKPGKSCCLLHGEGRNLHLHIQVNCLTKRII